MEKYGLTNIDIRSNEDVRWLCPPYETQSQQSLYQRMKKLLALEVDPILPYMCELLKLGGASEKMIEQYKSNDVNRRKQLLKAIEQKKGTYAESRAALWSVWGFK